MKINFPNRNKFKILNKKSMSLTKVNPYYNNKNHYLPYKYSDPIFCSTFQGPLMQKDYYILNLMNNRLNKNKNKNQNQNRLNHFSVTNSPQRNLGSVITKESVLSLNSNEFHKQSYIENYKNYALSLLKDKYYRFNPLILKENSSSTSIKRKKNNQNFYTCQNSKKSMSYFLEKCMEDINHNNNNNFYNINNIYKKREKIKEKYSKTNYDENKYVLFDNKSNKNNISSNPFKNVNDIKKILNTKNLNMNKNKNLEKRNEVIKISEYTSTDIDENNKNLVNSKGISISVTDINGDKINYCNNNNNRTYLPYLTSDV